MTPYALVSRSAQVRGASKRELVGISRGIERAALQSPPPAVAATLQDVRYLTARTRAVYASLADAGAPGRLHGRGVQAWLAPGVEGVDLADDDPLVDEWVVVVPGPEALVLAATDLRAEGCAEQDRSFTYAISRETRVVEQCGRLLGI